MLKMHFKIKQKQNKSRNLRFTNFFIFFNNKKIFQMTKKKTEIWLKLSQIF